MFLAQAGHRPLSPTIRIPYFPPIITNGSPCSGAWPKTANDIVFLGNSINDGGEWSELFPDTRLKNRGISGDVTTGVPHRLPNIVESNPSGIFLLIGINDLARGVPPYTVLAHIRLIVSLIHSGSPGTQVYVQSLFPVNPEPGLFPHMWTKAVT